MPFRTIQREHHHDFFVAMLPFNTYETQPLTHEHTRHINRIKTNDLIGSLGLNGLVVISFT